MESCLIHNIIVVATIHNHFDKHSDLAKHVIKIRIECHVDMNVLFPKIVYSDIFILGTCSYISRHIHNCVTLCIT